LGLFAAVTALYLITWFGTQDSMTAQTVAFFSWLIGHVLLAFNMRSERQPMFQLGLTSNRMMLIWGAAVATFLFAVSLIPGAQHLMKVTALTGSQWIMILIASFIGTFWLEIKKMVTYRKQFGN
jgi:Ca2+-transporting ATPase